MADERTENVWLNLPKEFVRENIPVPPEHRHVSADGKVRESFNAVSVPRGVMIGGQDVGGYQFNPLFVNKSKYDEGWRGIPLIPEKEIRLQKTELDENRKPIIGEDGKKVVHVIKTTGTELVAAVEAAREAYRKEHSSQAADKNEQETVWVNVHEKFVREIEGKNGNTFYSVGIMQGVVVDGKDVSNFRFNCNFINTSPRNEHMRGIPFNADKEITLRGGEGFKEVVKVMPADLESAIVAARSERQKAQQQDQEKPSSAAPVAESREHVAKPAATQPERKPTFAEAIAVSRDQAALASQGAAAPARQHESALA